MQSPSILRRHGLHRLLFACTATLLASCASGPYAAKLFVEGGEQLNPTFDSLPSSVNIRIVQLKKKDAFESATDAELFSPDLKKQPWVVSYQEAKVRVGLMREVEITIQPEVLFLGIVGMFNETDGEWRSVIDVSTLDSNKLVFNEYKFSAEPRQ